MEPTCVRELKECREPQRRETGTGVPSEDGTASPDLSQDFLGRFRKLPKQIPVLGSLRQNPDPTIYLCVKVALEIKLISLTYRFCIRGEKKTCFGLHEMDSHSLRWEAWERNRFLGKW